MIEPTPMSIFRIVLTKGRERFLHYIESDSIPTATVRAEEKFVPEYHIAEVALVTDDEEALIRIVWAGKVVREAVREFNSVIGEAFRDRRTLGDESEAVKPFREIYQKFEAAYNTGDYTELFKLITTWNERAQGPEW